MTAIAYRPKLGSELEYVGPMSAVGQRRVEVVQFEAWYSDTYRPDTPVLMGRNGRPRNRITLPGHGKGVRPANHGKRFPPEPLTPAEALSILAIIDPTTKAGVRNRALIALLWRTGLRISEALDLRPHHVDFGARRVTVLHGKGDKRRTVGIDDGGLIAVQPWLLERQFILQAVPERAQVRRARRHPEARSPHGFRHSIACDLIKERFGITDVQAQLGHSNVATTATYLKGMGADEAFEKVAERVWPGGAS